MGSLSEDLKLSMAGDLGVKPAPKPNAPKDDMAIAAVDTYKKTTEYLTPEIKEFRKAAPTNINVSQYDKKIEKLQSYGSLYQQYGFNPYINNEKFFDAKTSTGEQWIRTLEGTKKLFNIGFQDNALFGAFSQADSHREYAKTVDIYTSTRGGKTGMLQNLVLNSGYTVGIIADMALEEAVLAGITILTLGASSEVTAPNMIGKIAQSTKNIKNAYSMYSKLGRLMKTANTVENTSTALKLLNFVNPLENTTNFVKTLKSADAFKDISNFGKIVKGSGELFRDVKAAHLTLSESDIEAGNVEDDLYKDLVSKHKGELTKEAADRYRKRAKEAGYWAKMENIFVIGATNKLVFNNMYKAFDDLKGIGKIIGDNKFYTLARNQGASTTVLRKGFFKGGFDRSKMMFADGFSKGVYRTGKGIISKAGKYSSGNIAEGIQENLQEAIVAKNNHMYGSAEQGTYFESVLHGLKSQFSSQGAETFLSGFLMGGLVSPVTMSVKAATDLTQGGGYKYFTDNKNYRASKEAEFNRLENDANLINELITDAADVFKVKGSSLADQAQLETQMIQAAANGDKHEFQNAKEKSYRKHLMVAMKYDMMDQFQEHLAEMKTMNAEQFKEAFKTTDPNMSVAERHQMIDRKIAKAEQFKEDYRWAQKNMINPIDVNRLDKNDSSYKATKAYHDYFERSKEELIFARSEFQDNVSRKENMLSSMRSEVEAANISYNDYQKLFNPETINGEVSILRDEIKALDYSELDEPGKKLIGEKKAKLKALERFSESLNEMNDIAQQRADLESIDEEDLTPKEKKQLKKLDGWYNQASTRVFNRHNEYLKTLAPKLKGAAFENFSQKSFDILHDYYKLENKNFQIDVAINVLTNPGLLNEHLQRQVKMHDAFMAQFKRYVKNSIAMARNKDIVQTGLTDLLKAGIGFPMQYLDRITEEGMAPPVLYDLETDEVLMPKVSIKNKKGKIINEKVNEKYVEGMKILKSMYSSLHNTPTEELQEATEEEVVEAANMEMGAENSIAGAEADTIESPTATDVEDDYVPTIEDDELVTEQDDLESYPPMLINTLIKAYKQEVANGNFYDPNVSEVTPNNFNARFRQWVSDNSETVVKKAIREHNERVEEIPSTYESLSAEEREALMDLGYETQEDIDALSVLDVQRIIKQGVRYAAKEPEEEVSDEVEEDIEEEETPSGLADELIDNVEIIIEDEEDINEEDTTEITGEDQTTNEGETDQETGTEQNAGDVISDRDKALASIQFVAADFDHYVVPSLFGSRMFTYEKDAIKAVNDYFDKLENESLTEAERTAQQITKNFEDLAKTVGEASAKKMQEYADRINAGESKESVLQGLSPSFVAGVNSLLGVTEESTMPTVSINQNATDEEIDATIELIISNAEENGLADQLVDEFQEPAPPVASDEETMFTDESLNEDTNLSYREKRAQVLYQYAMDSTDIAMDEDGVLDFTSALTAIKDIVVENLGGELLSYSITPEVVRDVFELLRQHPNVNKRLLNKTSKAIDKLIYDYLNPEILDAKNQSKASREESLLKQGFTKKDIKSFSEETKTELITKGTTKKQYVASLKKLKVSELKVIKDVFANLDTNVRTEKELTAIISKISLENQEVFDKHEDAIFHYVNDIKNELATLVGFSNLKVGDVIQMNDGSLKKVEKLEKNKVTLVNYNSIIQNAETLSKSDFDNQHRAIINEFNKDYSVSIKTEMAKQNIDELSQLLSTFTGGALMTVDSTPANEATIKEHFKMCK